MHSAPPACANPNAAFTPPMRTAVASAPPNTPAVPAEEVLEFTPQSEALPAFYQEPVADEISAQTFSDTFTSLDAPT